MSSSLVLFLFSLSLLSCQHCHLLEHQNTSRLPKSQDVEEKTLINVASRKRGLLAQGPADQEKELEGDTAKGRRNPSGASDNPRRTDSPSRVSWRVPRVRAGRGNPCLDEDYVAPRTHTPSHNK